MTKLQTYIAVSLLVVGSPAFGGEVGGNGNLVPGGSTGNSACAYSGLNDEYYVEGDLSAPRVQSYGQMIAAFRGRPPLTGIPGIACRGN